MKSWKLSIVQKEFSVLSNFKKHRSILRSSWKFWLLLLLKIKKGIFDKPVLFTLKNGGKFFVEDFMTLYIYKEIFADGCYDSIHPLNSSPVVVDVGANTGLFTLRMKQLYPLSEIYCFEPDDANYKQLIKTIEISGLKNIHPIKKGVGSSSRVQTLYLNSTNIGGHSILPLENTYSNIQIELTGINQLFTELNIAGCDLLKMDCEGAEFEILKSISTATAPLIKQIIFEPSHNLYNVDELLEHLAHLGFAMREEQGIHIGQYKR